MQTFKTWKPTAVKRNEHTKILSSFALCSKQCGVAGKSCTEKHNRHDEGTGRCQACGGLRGEGQDSARQSRYSNPFPYLYECSCSSESHTTSKFTRERTAVRSSTRALLDAGVASTVDSVCLDSRQHPLSVTPLRVACVRLSPGCSCSVQGSS